MLGYAFRHAITMNPTAMCNAHTLENAIPQMKRMKIEAITIAPLGICLGGSFCGFLRAVWGVFCPASPSPTKAKCGKIDNGDLWGCAFNAWGLLQDIPNACGGSRMLGDCAIFCGSSRFWGWGCGVCLPALHPPVKIASRPPTCVAPWRAWGCGVCLRVVWGLFLPFCGLFLGWGVCVPACLLCLHPEHLKCARYRQCWALIWGGCFLPMLPFLIVPAGASGFDFL